MRENSEFDITNAGYTIIATVPVYTEEIVIGSRLTKTGDMEYVCWFYNRSHDDYYWGIYVNTYEEALSALFKRVRDYYSYVGDEHNANRDTQGYYPQRVE